MPESKKSETTTPTKTVSAALFSDAERTDICRALAESFSERLLGNERFDVNGELRGDEVIVTVTLSTDDRSRVATFTASLLVNVEAGDTLAEARAAAVEFVHAWINDWLRSDREERPHLDWKEYDWERRVIRFRGSDVAQNLVELADELLRKAGFEGDL